MVATAAPAAGPPPVTGSLDRQEALSGATAQTPEMTRAEAISGRTVGAQQLWMGKAIAPAGKVSAVHHHAAGETAIYVLRGRVTLFFGEGLRERLEVQAGDYLFVPAWAIHAEGNLSGEDTEPVRWRSPATVTFLPSGRADRAGSPSDRPPSRRSQSSHDRQTVNRRRGRAWLSGGSEEPPYPTFAGRPAPAARRGPRPTRTAATASRRRCARRSAFPRSRRGEAGQAMPWPRPARGRARHPPVAWRRHCAGGLPMARLNARLNASSDS
jgi:uncharacterized RmlC-like cupin family protein